MNETLTSMARKSGSRFSLATNAERVCAEAMLQNLKRGRFDAMVLAAGADDQGGGIAHRKLFELTKIR